LFPDLGWAAELQVPAEVARPACKRAGQEEEGFGGLQVAPFRTICPEVASLHRKCTGANLKKIFFLRLFYSGKVRCLLISYFCCQNYPVMI